ncbi:MAG TPA: SDR family oxidoreductase [Ignavibacteria bacterium]|nr:SDR family oxidoreductase [Ignavibacteria bacterium]
MENKKVLLITGSRKGIGRYLSEYYCEKNFTVIGCSRGKSDFENKNYRHFELDITDENKVKSMFNSVRKDHGRLDVLINNAGIASMNHIMLTPLKTVENIFDTNFLGSFLFCREASKIMIKNKSGRIINLSSVAAGLNLEGEAIYAASKSALVTFSKILAKELSIYNITVNTIGLTPVETDLIKNVPKVKMDELLKKLSSNRFGKFSDISNVTDFLINEQSDFITGQNINLGGV